MASVLLLLKVLVLLGIANGAPIFATKLLKHRLAARLDGGLRLRDGGPLFGESKTIRGIVVSVACTALAAPLLGFNWILGAELAAASMAGDLLASFLKRRLGLKVHAQALGLDQIPEALLPLLVLQSRLGISAGEIIWLVAAFTLLDAVLSYLLYRLRIREQPY